MQRLPLPMGSAVPPPAARGHVIVLLSGAVLVHGCAASLGCTAPAGSAGAAAGRAQAAEAGAPPGKGGGDARVSGSGINFGGGSEAGPAGGTAAGALGGAAASACSGAASKPCASEPASVSGPCLLGSVAAAAAGEDPWAEAAGGSMVAATALECWLLEGRTLRRVRPALAGGLAEGRSAIALYVWDFRHMSHAQQYAACSSTLEIQRLAHTACASPSGSLLHYHTIHCPALIEKLTVLPALAARCACAHGADPCPARRRAQFCRRHSATARRLRFLRNVPLLKGLADAALLAAAANMAEHRFAVRAMLTRRGLGARGHATCVRTVASCAAMRMWPVPEAYSRTIRHCVPTTIQTSAMPSVLRSWHNRRRLQLGAKTAKQASSMRKRMCPEEDLLWHAKACRLVDKQKPTSAARRSRQAGQALPCGAGGECLYIVRHGFVRAALAAGDGSALLGRGHLVGSRALIDGAIPKTSHIVKSAPAQMEREGERSCLLHGHAPGRASAQASQENMYVPILSTLALSHAAGRCGMHRRCRAACPSHARISRRAGRRVSLGSRAPGPAGKLRRARCRAAGACEAVALPRRVLDALDAPALAGALDLEAVDAALQVRCCASTMVKPQRAALPAPWPSPSGLLCQRRGRAPT